MITQNESLVVSHSGIRGRPGAGLDRPVVEEVVGGLVALLSERDLPRTLAVARDERATGEVLAAAVIEAGTARGADVVDLGIVATPTAKLAARQRRLGGAIVVTGSHLEPGLNGLKLVAAPDYWPLDPRRLPPPAREEAGGGVRSDSAADGDHAQAVCEAVDAEAIRGAGLRVALTGGCGAAAELALERLGCTLAGGHADLGMIMDEDGDRLQLVDERGSRVDPEATLPLAAIALDARSLVKGADTGRIAEAMADGLGWTVSVSPPGELHLLRRLTETNADLAGEGNGGVVIPRVGMARDGLAAGAVILELLARSGRPISALVADLPRLARRRVSLPYAPAAAAEALASLAERTGGVLGDPVEGVTLERPGGGWVLVRQSATEPVLRITVESPDERVADELYAEVRAALPAAP